MLSPHCKFRLEKFEEAIQDPEIPNKKAIRGLESWKYSQKHRLSSLDNAYIDSAIRRYSKVK